MIDQGGDPPRGSPRARRIAQTSGPYGWAVLSQLLSSATNFGLAVLAGRYLGAEGLGVVFLGFAAYLVLAGAHRSLVSDPLITSTSGSPERSIDATRHGATITLCFGAIASIGMLITGELVPSALGSGLTLVAPWLLPLLVQGYWRTAFFNVQRPRAAAANDGLWFLIMAASAPIAISVGSHEAVVACWATGGLAAALLGFVQTGIRPTTPSDAWRWWKAEAFPRARWFMADSAIWTVGTYLIAIVISISVDVRALGGLRSVHALFAPLTLIAQAISLPGLPALSRARRLSDSTARRLAFRLGLGAAAAVLIYLAIAWPFRDVFLEVVFGSEFESFRDLVLPVGVGQCLAAVTVGWPLLLRAQHRGIALVSARFVAMVVTVSTVWFMSIGYGVRGAAWGEAIGLASAAVVFAAVGSKKDELRQRRS